MFEELAHDKGGPSLNVELLSTYNLEPASAAMHFALNCIPGQAYLHLAPLDAIGAIVAAIEGPWLEAEYPPPLRGKKTNGDEQSRFIPSSTPRLFQSAGGTSSWQITQEAIAPSDSLVMVQRLLPQSAA